MKDIEIWSEENAFEWFNKIEKSNGKNESEIIDWKLDLNLNNTGFNNENDTNNTTQKVMSSFANTFGGQLVFGFNKNGLLVGFDIKDAENKISESFNNRKSTNLAKIRFKFENYNYKNKNVGVIFIEE